MRRKDKRIHRKIILDNPKSVAAEAFRTLRTNIQFSGIDDDVKTIVVTSSNIREGKTTVAVNLAITLAQANKNVLLIDGDMRKPTVHKYFDLTNNIGLTNIIAEGKGIGLVKKNIDKLENLDILLTGPIPPNPSEILSSNKFKLFINQVKGDYDYVVIDSPPILAVTDAAISSTVSDGVILVAAYNQTEKEELLDAKEQLDNVKANVLGVVLNGIDLKDSKYYYNYEYYGED